MRALLINPWIHDFKAFDFWNKPLGLLIVASLLKKHGFEVRLIDCLDRCSPHFKTGTHTDVYGRGKYVWAEVKKPQVYRRIPRRFKRYGMPVDTFTAVLKEIEPPDIIFVSSSMTYWYPGVIEAIRMARDTFPGSRIVLGGIYATLCVAHAKKHSGADHILAGPAEVALIGYLQSQGFDTQKTAFGSRWITPDFTHYRKLHYGVVLPSKGCPFKCSYCATPYLSPGYETAPWPQVVDQLEWFAAKDAGNVAFFDDALLFNKDLPMILENTIKRGIKINLHSSNGLHCRYIDARIARLMREAGFKTVYLSLESTDPAAQKNTGGKVYTREFERAVNAFKDAGFPAKAIHAYLLYGMPGQGYENTVESIRYCRGLGVNPHLCEFSPIPRTGEFQRSGLDEDSDPLYHNNFYYTWHYPGPKPEIYRRLKKELSGCDKV